MMRFLFVSKTNTQFVLTLLLSSNTDLQKHRHINFLNKIDGVLPDFIQQTKSNKTQQSAIFENRFGQKLLFKSSELNIINEKTMLKKKGTLFVLKLPTMAKRFMLN